MKTIIERILAAYYDRSESTMGEDRTCAGE
jgi:hypothetical protein